MRPVARLAVLLLAGATAASALGARPPSGSERRALTAALRAQQGSVAIGAIRVSSLDPGYARLDWGFANGGLSSRNTSVLARSAGSWRIVWTRESEQRADGACIYLPAPVAHELYGVGCPAAGLLRASPASAGQRAGLRAGLLASALTSVGRSATGLRHACISRLASGWAAAVARFPSGGSVVVFFDDVHGWKPVYVSLVAAGRLPPARVVLSLASCVGFNPADYEG
jgi:hypothetical protein